MDYMLALDRKLKAEDEPGERITMFVGGERIDVAFVKRNGARVKVCVDASQFVRVVRTELLDRLRDEPLCEGK
jgi:sRNA-binding carbon storage regulator CsrA